MVSFWYHVNANIGLNKRVDFRSFNMNRYTTYVLYFTYSAAMDRRWIVVLPEKEKESQRGGEMGEERTYIYIYIYFSGKRASQMPRIASPLPCWCPLRFITSLFIDITGWVRTVGPSKITLHSHHPFRHSSTSFDTWPCISYP